MEKDKKNSQQNINQLKLVAYLKEKHYNIIKTRDYSGNVTLI
jgi:hypothetical protein